MTTSEIIQQAKAWIGIWPERITDINIEQMMYSILNRVCKKIAGEAKWPWLMRTDITVPVTAGSETFVLPNNLRLLYILRVFRKVGSDKHELQSVPVEIILKQRENNVSGETAYYCVMSVDTIAIYPKPTVDTEFIVHGVVEPARIVSDTETNEVIKNVPELVFYGLLLEASLFVRSGDLIDFYTNKYNEALLDAHWKFGMFNQGNRRPQSTEP